MFQLNGNDMPRMDLLPQNMIEILQLKYSPLQSVYSNLEVKKYVY